jgi:hypothetical protein
MAALTAFSMATVTDGINGLGLGDNPAFPVIWRAEKRLDAGITVKNDLHIKDEGVQRDRMREVVNQPWLSWTDRLGNAHYSVKFLNGSYTSKYDRAIKDNRLAFTLAQDFDGIIAGFNVGYQSLSQKPKGAKATVANPLKLGLGLATRLSDRQLVLLGYSTGLEYTETTNTKPKKTEADKIQGTDIALGYVYTVSETWQLGAQFISGWTPDYDPCQTYGLAASYLPVREIELQGFLNLSPKTRANSQHDIRGTKDTNYGVNVQWTPSFANIGTLGAGVSVTRKVDNENTGYVSSKTTGSLFYTYLL